MAVKAKTSRSYTKREPKRKAGVPQSVIVDAANSLAATKPDDEPVSLGDILQAAIDKSKKSRRKPSARVEPPREEEPKTKRKYLPKRKPFELRSDDREKMQTLLDEKGFHYYYKNSNLDRYAFYTPSKNFFKELRESPEKFGAAVFTFMNTPTVWKEKKILPLEIPNDSYFDVLPTMSVARLSDVFKTSQPEDQLSPFYDGDIFDPEILKEEHTTARIPQGLSCGVMALHDDGSTSYQFNFDVRVYRNKQGDDCIILDVKKWVTLIQVRTNLESILNTLLNRHTYVHLSSNFSILVCNAVFDPDSNVKLVSDTDKNGFKFHEHTSSIYGANRTIFSESSYANIDEHRSNIVMMTEEMFIDRWVNALSERTKVNLEKNEKHIRILERQMLQARAKLAQDKQIAQAIKTSFHSHYKGVTEKLRNVQGVRSVELVHGCFAIESDEVWHVLTDKDKDEIANNVSGSRRQKYEDAERVYIGRFKIFLDVVRNSAWIVNIAMANNTGTHPHGMNQSLCLGGWHDMILSAMENNDLPLCVEVILEMLRNCDEDGRDVLHYFPTEAPKLEDCSRGKSLSLFGEINHIANFRVLNPQPVPDIEKAKEQGEYAEAWQAVAEVDEATLRAYPVDEDDGEIDDDI